MITCLNPATAWLEEPEAYIALAAKNGFQGADAGADHWAAWVKRTSLDHVRGYCAEKNCVIGHGGMPVNFREDEAAFEAGLAALPGTCEIMKNLGLRGMATWIMPATPGDVAEFRAMHVRRLKKVSDVMKGFGLKLGLEFVGPKSVRDGKNPFVYDMPGMLGLCDEIDPDNCGLLFDSYHWHATRGTVEDILSLDPKRIVLAHINDAYPVPIDELEDLKRLLPGDGVIDLIGFLKALDTIGYDGPLALETFDEELRRIGPEEAAKRAGKALGDVMQKAGVK
jgi:sugar phosphate isomerase/epimerase